MIIKIPNIKKLFFVKAYVYNSRIKIGNANRYVTKYINSIIPKKAGIYFLFDKNKQLLYIGETKNLANRISTHRKVITPYWIKFFVLDKSRDYRVGIEHILIDKHKPILSKPKFKKLLRWY